MDVEILEEIGLTKAQSKVYLALIELGETTTGPILAKTELHNSVVYNALSRLEKNGLVSYIVKGKTKYFFATNPENILKYINNKKDKVEELIPELIKKQSLNMNQQNAQIFKGWKGIYNAFNFILETLPQKEEYIGFAGALGEQHSEETHKFFQNFQKKRSIKKYNIKLIANETERKKIEEYEYYPKFGKPNYRYVNGFAPVGLIIFGDNTLTFAFEEENPIAVITTSKLIAKTNRDFFYNMWKITKNKNQID